MPDLQVLTGGRISGPRSRHEGRGPLVDALDRARTFHRYNPGMGSALLLLAARDALLTYDASVRPRGDGPEAA